MKRALLLAKWTLGAVHKLRHTEMGEGASQICDKMWQGGDLKNCDVTKDRIDFDETVQGSKK